MIIMSASESLENCSANLSSCSTERFAILEKPFAPAINLNPNSVGVTISCISFCLLTTCIKLYCGTAFKSTLIFASPKSPSIKMTFFPCCAYPIAIFTEIFVLPTPPFPLVTAIIRVLWGVINSRSSCAWSSIIQLPSLWIAQNSRATKSGLIFVPAFFVKHLFKMFFVY